MPTSSANSLSFKSRKEKRILCPFSSAFFPGEMRLTQRRKLSAARGILPMTEVEL
jgi:hypothetical protein